MPLCCRSSRETESCFRSMHVDMTFHPKILRLNPQILARKVVAHLALSKAIYLWPVPSLDPSHFAALARILSGIACL